MTEEQPPTPETRMIDINSCRPMTERFGFRGTRQSPACSAVHFRPETSPAIPMPPIALFHQTTIIAWPKTPCCYTSPILSGLLVATTPRAFSSTSPLTVCANDTSIWSPMDTFAAICRAPDSSYTWPIALNGARFNWLKVTGALGYEIKGRKTGTSNWTNQSVNGGNSLTKNVSGLSSAASYEWAVRAGATRQGSINLRTLHQILSSPLLLSGWVVRGPITCQWRIRNSIFIPIRPKIDCT